MKTQHRRLLVVFSLLTSGADAQWLNFQVPGTPRTRDGKPNLAAPAPELQADSDIFETFCNENEKDRAHSVQK